MAQYLLQFSYAPEAWAALMAKPVDRWEVVRPLITKLGGTMENAWFCLGEYDVAAILTMPTNVDAAAFALAIASGGAVRNVKTTALMTNTEGMEAMRKAASLGYVPPTKRS